MMQVSHLTLLLLVVACFSSFAWALRGHFVSGQMGGYMRLVAVLGTVTTGLQILAMIDAGSPGPLRAGLSTLLYALSLATFWWTVTVTRIRRLSVAFSSDEPNHLLQSGPYRFVRHPFYAAYATFWIAGVVAVSRWYLLLCVATMLVLYFRAARMEESKFAKSALREVYEGYRSKTGMFLPRLKIILTVMLSLCSLVAVAQAQVAKSARSSGSAGPSISISTDVLVLQSENVNVHRITISPGSSGYNYHHAGGSILLLSDYSFQIPIPLGTELEARFKAGEVIQIPAGDYLLQNTSGKPLDFLSFEMKTESSR